MNGMCQLLMFYEEAASLNTDAVARRAFPGALAGTPDLLFSTLGPLFQGNLRTRPAGLKAGFF